MSEEDQSTKGWKLINWKPLLDFRNHEERALVNPVQIENEGHAFVDSMTRDLECMFDALMGRAICVTDDYYEEEREYRNTGERCFVRSRIVRTSSGSLSLSWVKQRSRKIRNSQSYNNGGKVYQRQVDGENEDYKILHDYIKKGLGSKYTKRVFRSEPVWAQNQIEECEEYNEILRKQAKLLQTIRKSLEQFDRLQTEYYDKLLEKYPFELQQQRLSDFNTPERKDRRRAQDNVQDDPMDPWVESEK